MRTALAVGIWLCVGSVLRAQGGPPMLTDDPGTPGSRRWEINLGWNAQHLPGSVVHWLPLVDANYGIGDRVELTYTAPMGFVNGAGQRQSGIGNSEISAKWRFLDVDSSWQISIYPALDFQTPGTRSVDRLTDSSHTLELPFEVERDLGPISANLDLGRNFSTAPGNDSWFGGLALGKEVRKGWELDAELHVNSAPRFDQNEFIVRFGTRIDLSRRFTLMAAYGRDASNSLSPYLASATYVGLQIRLGHGVKGGGARSGRHPFSPDLN